MLQRIQKILASAGIGSRRACEELIAAGRIRVNGDSVKLGDKADPAKDLIELDGKPIPKAEKYIYIVLNKPKHVVTTVTDPYEMNTVMKFIDVPERIYPVGRLDKNSEGLLLMTNDGPLTQRLLHPSHGVDKVYRVRLDRNFSSADTKELLDGVMVEKRAVKIKKFHRVGKSEVTIKIHEGRRHIVRRVFKELGYHVVKLTRLSFGPLKLQNLKPGEWRHLKKEEIEKLKGA